MLLANINGGATSAYRDLTRAVRLALVFCFVRLLTRRHAAHANV
jgi:hypothetical protein